MNTIIRGLFTLILLAGFVELNAQCQAGRYHDKIFSSKTTFNVPYGSGITYQGSSQNLSMNIYEPSNDNFERRPLIILAFGGSFTGGNKLSPDLLVLCDEFAKRGYVTASIDYRIGKENGDDTSMYKAVIRAIQDMAASIRFFNKDAATVNKYHIDPSQIFIGGTSAGGFMALNKAYFKPEASRPINDDLVNLLIRMGGFSGGNTGSSEYMDNNVKGVINLCGAILDTVWLQPGDPVLCGVHGTADSTVPYFYDSIRGITDIKSRFYGSGDLINRANHIGLNHSIYTFVGADHAPFVLPSTPYISPSKEYMDTTIQVVRDFLYANVVCDATPLAVRSMEEGLPVVISPNPGEGQVQVNSTYANRLNIEVFGMDGKLLQTKSLQPGSVTSILKEEVGVGMFLLRISDQADPGKISMQKAVIY